MSGEQVLRIPADLDRMNEVLDFANSLVDSHSTTPETRMQLRIVIEELYANIAHYAYPSGDGWAEIRGSVEDGVATFSSSTMERPLTLWQSRIPMSRFPGKSAKSAALAFTW